MNFEKRVLPLAGIAQAVHLVVGAAKHGMVAQDSLDRTLAPIFVQNPDSITDVYQGTKNIGLGLNLLQEMLTNFQSEAHGDLVRYSMAIMGLERALSAQPDKLAALGNGIALIDTNRTDTEDMPVKALADLYEQVLGTIEPRIKVSGNRDTYKIWAMSNEFERY